uniref:Uncharacterized protein n=1 Tax=Arundo donax TaxID=35708 RepID=A0A0A8XYS3_ARUDO
MPVHLVIRHEVREPDPAECLFHGPHHRHQVQVPLAIIAVLAAHIAGSGGVPPLAERRPAQWAAAMALHPRSDAPRVEHVVAGPDHHLLPSQECLQAYGACLVLCDCWCW